MQLLHPAENSACVYDTNTERSEQVWTGVTGTSLWNANALAAGKGERMIAMIQPTTFP